MDVRCSLTVLFEAPFWVGLYERYDGRRYEVCKVTFGAEPRDNQVYEFFLANWRRLSFSPPSRTEKDGERRINPKRMKREIRDSLLDRGVGTKAQQALKLQYEQNKEERRKRGREERQLEKDRQFDLRREKKKEKHKGR